MNTTTMTSLTTTKTKKKKSEDSSAAFDGRLTAFEAETGDHPPMSTETLSETLMMDDELMTAEEFLDRELGPSNGRPSSSYSPMPSPIPAPHVAVEPVRDPRSKVLPRLLKMADFYLKTGALRQALEMYFDLYRNHEDSPEAETAEDRILEVARIHEENGELHLARAIYDQLI
jgi:hypothetical protein